MGERRHEEVRQAVLIEILKQDAHAGEFFAVIVVGHSGDQAVFGESPVPKIPEEELRMRVVGDRDIGPAVLVVVAER